MESERMLILQMVAEKKITPDQAVELLKALGSPPQSRTETPPADQASSSDQARNQAKGTGESGRSGEAGRAGSPAQEAGQKTGPAAPGPEGQTRSAHDGATSPHRTPGIDASWAGELGMKIGSIVESIISNFGFGFGDGYRFEETFEGEFGDTTGPLRLDFESRNGRIAVEAWDRPVYAVRLVKYVRGVSENEAKTRADQLAKVVREPGLLSVQMVSPIASNVGMAIVACVPRAGVYDVRLNTANGRIELRDLKCTKVEGRTANGAIKLDNVDADSVTLTTSNGKVLLKTSANRVKAQSSNGKIVLVPFGEQDHSYYELTTSNGSVKIRISNRQDTGFLFDLSTSNGKIDIPETQDLDYEVNEKSHGRRYIKARSKGFESKPRNVTVVARTSNGRISLDESVEWE